MALISPIALAACAPPAPMAEDLIPDYLGVEALTLDEGLVQVKVAMTKALSSKDVETYADCAASQYALDQGDSFARHLRTNVNIEGGVWSADAVYTTSPTLPEGVSIIDVEVVANDCKARGIPTV